MQIKFILFCHLQDFETVTSGELHSKAESEVTAFFLYLQEEEDFFYYYRQFVALLVSKREICLFDVFAIDGFEIVLHGDDDISVFAPLVGEFERFLAVGVVAAFTNPLQIYADFLSFFFLPNLRATLAQGLLIDGYLKRG